MFKQIAKMEGQPIKVTDWFNFYSFDVMGDLAFGKSFHMLRDGIKHYFMTALHGFMIGVGLFSHLLWLFPIFKKTPVLNAEDKKFWYWVLDQVEERKRVRTHGPKKIRNSADMDRTFPTARTSFLGFSRATTAWQSPPSKMTLT